MTETSTASPPFTWAGFRQGALLSLAFGASSFVYGIAFGVLASEAGIGLVEVRRDERDGVLRHGADGGAADVADHAVRCCRCSSPC